MSAASATDYLPTDFNVGRVIERSLSVFGRRAQLLLGICAVLAIPSYFISVAIAAHPLTYWLWFASLGWSIVQSSFATAFIVYAVFSDLRGVVVTTAESINYGIRCILPVLLMSLILSIACLIGFLLLIVPGIILAVLLTASVQSCVIERLTPLESIKRSLQLTRGHGWQIFAIYLLIFLTLGIAAAIINGVVGFALHALPVWIHVIPRYLMSIASTAFGVVLATVVYHDLRVAREGIDIDQLAGIFD